MADYVIVPPNEGTKPEDPVTFKCTRCLGKVVVESTYLSEHSKNTHFMGSYTVDFSMGNWPTTK